MTQLNLPKGVHLNRAEYGLLIALLAMLVFGIVGPSMAQPSQYHDFADQRIWQRIPFATDVLTNLAFAFWGVAGLLGLIGLRINTSTKGLASLFFAGLVITAGASSWYHLQPADTGLAVDRLGMVFAFAGLLGLAAADRVSLRSGVVLSVAMLVLGALSVWVSVASGNVLAWLVLQFGGMLLILWLARLSPLPGALAVHWVSVMAIYAFAKVLELNDHAVFDFTAQWVSGHSLKHIVASCAAWPVISAIRQHKAAAKP